MHFLYIWELVIVDDAIIEWKESGPFRDVSFFAEDVELLTDELAKLEGSFSSRIASAMAFIIWYISSNVFDAWIVSTLSSPFIWTEILEISSRMLSKELYMSISSIFSQRARNCGKLVLITDFEILIMLVDQKTDGVFPQEIAI